MSNSIMYQEDAYLVLESDQPEQFLTPDELLVKLQKVLSTYPSAIPQGIKTYENLSEQARYLRDNFCDLDIGEGKYFQWYVIRLEK